MAKKRKQPTLRKRPVAERESSLPLTERQSGSDTKKPRNATTCSQKHRSGSLRGGPALVLALLVVVSYLPAFQAGFVWDDVIFVDEPVVHDWSGLWNIWFSPADIKKEGHYWPIVYTSFWLEHKIWGLAPLGYHAVNILFHLVNVLLIWRLLQRLAVPGAWCIAAVFALHPLHVESVAWVIERKDVLSGLFYLTAVLTWIRFVKAPRPGLYMLALVLFTAGLLSKSIVVTLPAALLIWQWWQTGRVTRTDLIRSVPFFAVAIFVTSLDLAFYTSREPLSLGYSFVDRILIASRALWFYVGKLLWPSDLAVIYPLWDISAADPVAWVYVLAALALVTLLWFGRARLGRGPLAGALFFAVTLSPVLGFVDYGYMQFSLVADRFQYLAGLGVMGVLLGAATSEVSRLTPVLRKGAAGLFILVLAVLGTLTWRQASLYRDGVTFFSHIIAHNPEARMAHLNLVGPLADVNRHEEALAAARIGVERRPDDADGHSNLGRVLVLLDRLDEAEEVLRTALELSPKHLNAHQNLGETLRKRGRHGEAIEIYQKTLELDADLSSAHAGLGISLFHLKRYEDSITALGHALALGPDVSFTDDLHLFAGRAARRLDHLGVAETHFRRAAALHPDTVEPLMELSKLLLAQRRSAEAEEVLRRARELRPSDPAPLASSAEAIRKAGRHDEAIALYREALRLDPDFAPAQVGMGAALFDLRRSQEAFELLVQSLSQDMDSPTKATAHYLAGRSLRELDRPAEAAMHFEQCIALDPKHTQALDYLAHWRFGQKEYEKALELYRAHTALQPENVTVHANMGVTLYYLDRHEEAMATLDRVLELDPNHEIARKLSARLRAVAVPVLMPRRYEK